MTQAFCPLEINDLILFHLKSKAEPDLLSVVTSEIILFLTIAIKAKGFVKIFNI